MKQIAFSSILLLLLLLCVRLSAQHVNVQERSDFKQYFDAYQLQGSFLLYDQDKQQWLAYNTPRTYQGFLPASTFKILNSLIAFELGLVQDTSSILAWNGESHWNPAWNKNLSLREAFAVSCVPCYRELARKAGLERMQQLVQAADYGSMDITAENLDLFWLQGNSRITQWEQIDFLQRLHEQQLPFSKKSLQQVALIMLREHHDAYQLFGKTGLTLQEQQTIGSYVGYLINNGKPYYFALNIVKEADEQNPAFNGARTAITKEILRALSLMQ